MLSAIGQRSKVLEEANSDPALQAIILEHLSKNPTAFLQDWCWTYDPRLLDEGCPTTLPFIPWPRQAEFIQWLHDHIQAGNNCMGDKSRDWGATWLCVYYAVWRWLFSPGYTVTFGSRKVELVDKRGDLKSILEKVRFCLRNLPKWMLPVDDQDKIFGLGSDNDNHLLIRNPETLATIAGEGGEEMGRGGRSSWYMIDEWATVPKAENVNAAVSGNARSVFYLSTPKGMGNLHAQMRFSGEIPVFVMDWRDDPRKSSQWREAQIKKYGLLIVRQEVDRDYGATEDEVAIPPAWVQAAIDLKLPAIGKRQAGLDVATTGQNANVLALRAGPVLQNMESWNGMNTTSTYHKAALKSEQYNVEDFCFDIVGVGAGVQGAHETSERNYRMQVKGVNGASSPSKGMLWDAPKVRANKRFLNLRAENIWRLRLRFQKTWESIEGIQEHPAEECISIPYDQELISQLMTPRIKHSGKGHLRIESKREMRSRGVKSPDKFDAVVLAFYEPPVFRLLMARA